MNIPESFENIKVLVVGDVMLDRYWWGEVTRISPEAPVPVVRLRTESLSPGGAANVAANVAGLGAKAYLVGCVGDDRDASTLEDILGESGVFSSSLLRCGGKRTTTKTRIIAHSQQVARVDQENVESLNEEETEDLLNAISKHADVVGAIVLSDYAKGVLNERVIRETIAIANARQIPVIVDPKGRDYSKYLGSTLLTPNRKEAIEACKLDENDAKAVELAGGQLLAEIGVDAVLITQGEEGMTLFRNSAEPLRLSASAREVYDVTGAGDTVIGTLGVALASGFELAAAAELANIAAGLVVEQVGTTPVSIEDLEQALEKS